MWCVWLSSVARSCATRDASNKDYVCKKKERKKVISRAHHILYNQHKTVSIHSKTSYMSDTLQRVCNSPARRRGLSAAPLRPSYSMKVQPPTFTKTESIGSSVRAATNQATSIHYWGKAMLQYISNSMPSWTS